MDDNNGRRYEPDRPKTKRKVVQSLIDHTYYNCSLVNVEEELARRSSQRHHKYKNPNRKGLTTNFPAKLHKILSNPEFRHIIRWMVRANVFHALGETAMTPPFQFILTSFTIHSSSSFKFRLASNFSLLASRHKNSSSSLMAARGRWLIKIYWLRRCANDIGIMNRTRAST
jgi:hypothetical protein